MSRQRGWKQLNDRLYRLRYVITDDEVKVEVEHHLVRVNGIWRWHCNDRLGWRPNFGERNLLDAICVVGICLHTPAEDVFPSMANVPRFIMQETEEKQ